MEYPADGTVSRTKRTLHCAIPDAIVITKGCFRIPQTYWFECWFCHYFHLFLYNGCSLVNQSNLPIARGCKNTSLYILQFQDSVSSAILLVFPSVPVSAVWKISELNCFAWNPSFYCGKSHQAFFCYLDFKAVEQKAHIPTETCWSKQSDSASVFVNTQLFTFQFPLLWDIFLGLSSFQPGSEAKYYRVSIPSTCSQIQTSTKNYKYRRKHKTQQWSHKIHSSESCRNHELLLPNQSSSIKVSTDCSSRF